MPFDFDTPIDRAGFSSAKWNRYRGRDILPMWVADMDFRSPPAVIDALRERVEHGVFGYTDVPDELVEAVLEWLGARFKWAVAPEWLVWLPGLVTGINVACRSAGEEGGDILTTTPIYPPFLSAPRLAGRNTARVPMVRSGRRWEMDFDRFEAALGPDTRMHLLCNPHNPTGRVFSRDELERMCEACLRADALVCSDEIHCGLVLEKGAEHIPAASLDADIADRSITLMAPSKTYNIPGLGCSFAVIPNDQLRRRFLHTMSGIVPHVNALGYTAANAAYRRGEAWRLALVEYLRANRSLVEQEIGAMPGLDMGHVEATYLAWIDARPAGIERPVAFFERAGVGLSDGAGFGGKGFVRLNFGCPRPILRKALRRMSDALAGRGTAGRQTP